MDTQNPRDLRTLRQNLGHSAELLRRLVGLQPPNDPTLGEWSDGPQGRNPLRALRQVAGKGVRAV